MSIIWTLRKYIDSIAHREEEAAGQRDRRLAQRQGLGQPEETDRKAAGAAAIPHVCRVCGVRSDSGAYCPECLADTMVPLAEVEVEVESEVGAEEEGGG